MKAKRLTSSNICHVAAVCFKYVVNGCYCCSSYSEVDLKLGGPLKFHSKTSGGN